MAHPADNSAVLKTTDEIRSYEYDRGVESRSNEVKALKPPFTFGRFLMIKATGRMPNGMPVLILGLSGENVTRLIAGEPMRFNLTDIGMPPLEVVIHYGKTEEDIVGDLRQVFSFLEEKRG